MIVKAFIMATQTLGKNINIYIDSNSIVSKKVKDSVYHFLAKETWTLSVNGAR